MNNIRVSEVEYEYSPAGRRSVGRPRKRWTGQYMGRRRKPGITLLLLLLLLMMTVNHIRRRGWSSKRTSILIIIWCERDCWAAEWHQLQSNILKHPVEWLSKEDVCVGIGSQVTFHSQMCLYTRVAFQRTCQQSVHISLYPHLASLLLLLLDPAALPDPLV